MIYLLKISKKVSLLLKMECIDLINDDIEREEIKRMRIKLLLIKKVLLKRFNYKLIVNPYKRIEIYNTDNVLIRCFSDKESLFQWIYLLKYLGLL